MAKVRALLAGINDYPTVPLFGCVNDVENFHANLKSRFHEEDLAIEVLKNGEVTRDNLIAAFRQHLRDEADPGDVAVFHYCGHGSRSASAVEFAEFFNDDMDEGLVCIDSRQPDHYLLADKELAVLINELAPKDLHVCIILDCCHSGSGTRDSDSFQGMTVRSLPATSGPPRPLEAYTGDFYAPLAKQKERLFIPQARHMLLAACDRQQTAKETGDHKGVFTTSLVEAIGGGGAPISYADLFVRTRATVRGRADKQDPQFEPVGGFIPNAGFLGCDVVASKGRYFVYYKTAPSPADEAPAASDPGWQVDCGAINGLPTDAQAPVTFNVYPQDAPATSAGTAKAIKVGPERSALALDFPAETTARYMAEITSLPAAPLLMWFDGRADDRAAVEAALKDGAIEVALTASPEGVAYSLSAEPDSLVLAQREQGKLIQKAMVGQGGLAEAATLLAPAVQKIAAWERALALQNGATKMDPSKVDLAFVQVGADGQVRRFADPDVTLDYVRQGAAWPNLRGRFEARNGTTQPLYLTLIYFSQAYGVHALFSDTVQPAADYTTIWGAKPEDFFVLEPDQSASVERFKLLITTEPVDSYLFDQDELAIGAVLSPSRGLGAFTPPDAGKLFADEWFTKDARVNLVRRLDQLGGRDVALADGKILIKAHPAVTGDLALNGGRQEGRDISDGSDFYRALERYGMRMVDFSGARGDDLSVLEITDIQNADSLAAQPLRIELTTPIAPDEAIVPVVYDGRHVLVAGQFWREADGSTSVEVDRIPPVAGAERGLGGSLKMFFFKVALKQHDVNQLRWIDYSDASAAPTYQGSMVANKVAAAQNILVLVHGILGDTEDMAAAVQAIGLQQSFDLVLAFDYESLNTLVEDTATDLMAKLSGVGVAAGDGKRLTILAHGMGGLVARQLIERGGGKDIVDHLVMCGTPNQGSPFGEVEGARKVLSFLLNLAKNYVPSAAPYVTPVLMAVNLSQQVTRSLAEMKPGSGLLTALGQTPDPGVRYTVLAGDIDAYREPSDTHFPDLLDKLGKTALFKLLFAGKANDLMASADSIRAVHGDRADVACYHLNYFTSPAGQDGLKAVTWDTAQAPATTA